MDTSVVTIQQGLQAFYRSDEAGRPGARVSEVTLLGSGYETDVFAFSLEEGVEGAGKAQDLALRLYAGEGTAKTAAREFAVMGRLRKAGYPVPQVLAFEPDSALLGRPFVIMERIEGVSLGLSYWSGSEERRQASLALLCRLMVGLHTLEASAILPDSPLADSRDPYGCVDQELSMLAVLLSRLEGHEPPSLRDAFAWLYSHRTTVPCERLAVVHGDFHYNNVLVRADGAPFVIDWSNVRLGDYRSDLAWSRLVTQADARPDGGEAELRGYARLAGKEATGIAYFEIIACVRLLLSTLISLRFGAACQGMRPRTLTRQDLAFERSVAELLQKRTGIKMPDLEDALSTLPGGTQGIPRGRISSNRARTKGGLER